METWSIEKILENEKATVEMEEKREFEKYCSISKVKQKRQTPRGICGNLPNRLDIAREIFPAFVDITLAFHLVACTHLVGKHLVLKDGANLRVF